jgi:predicted transcriptional regulator
MLTKSIPTKFEASDLERLNYLSKLYDRPVSYLIREATRAYLDSQAKKIAFLQEAKMAADNFNSTGLHASHGEVKGWLSDLANGKINEKPVCHK